LLILGALRRDDGQRAVYLTTNGSGVNRHYDDSSDPAFVTTKTSQNYEERWCNI
jgi:hypothetical protein